MHTHVAAMAFLSTRGASAGSPGMARVSGMIAFLKETDPRTVDEFLAFVGKYIPRDEVVNIVMFARDPRWRDLAAASLFMIPDVKLTELEMIILCENSVNETAWQYYASRPDLTKESLQRSARQFREPWRTRAKQLLATKFPEV